ncbi:MAG: hypothetical protein KIG57_07330, partial [Muribaculaceae bacterium]|nr:hypothetical protein [Muribaculaceae bacterium]
FINYETTFQTNRVISNNPGLQSTKGTVLLVCGRRGCFKYLASGNQKNRPFGYFEYLASGNQKSLPAGSGR